MKLEEIPLQESKENEVRLKVEAIGLNRAEVLFREGAYMEPPKLPACLGYEAAGVIDAVGRGVTGFKAGDRVSTVPAFSMNDYGVYGEYVLVPVSALARYPENLTPQQGASIWMQYITAWGALVHYGKVGPGMSVVITAASSSVGLAAIELVKLAGAKSIASTRTSAKKQALLDFGADAVVASEEGDLPAAVKKLTGGKGADIFFDPVAGPFIEKLADAAAPGAQIFEYGSLAGAPTPFPLMAALQKGLIVRGYTLHHIKGTPSSGSEPSSTSTSS